MDRHSIGIAAVLLLGALVFVTVAAGLVPLHLDSPANFTLEEDTPTATGGELSFRFRAVEEAVGFDFTGTDWNVHKQQKTTNSGTYAVDYDHDGDTDLLAIGGRTAVLFENSGGEFRESDALPPLDRRIRAALFFDYDTDGWQDVLLLSLGQEPLLLENRAGEFVRHGEFGPSLPIPIGATAGEFTGDGCPDLFIIQNGNWSRGVPEGYHEFVVPDDEDDGNPNYLFEGDCRGGFTDVTETAGIRGTQWTLAVTTADFNTDGHQDIYVANDWNHDVLYRNRGNGTFARIQLSNRTNRNTMAAELGDVTGDGLPDVYGTNIELPARIDEHLPSTVARRYNGHTLLRNEHNGTFRDIAPEQGVHASGWGWAAAFADFDNDADADLVHATDWLRFSSLVTFVPDISPADVRRLHLSVPSLLYPALYERTEDGFQSRSAVSAGLHPQDGRGLSTIDFDQDGSLDLVISNVSGRYHLYENTGESPHHSIQISLRAAGNTTALGARVSVTTDGQTQVGYRNAKSDFLSQDSRTLHFGTGNATHATVRVRWPDGSTQTFDQLRTDRKFVLTPAGIIKRYAFS